MAGPQKHQNLNVDVCIAGAGVVGLALARTIRKRHPKISIAIFEKESDVAFHSSGRNSGVLHAGFYYTANSLKAKFTRDGNQAIKAFCSEKKIFVNPTRKVVVAQDEKDIAGIEELHRRGIVNGVAVRLIDEKELREIDPNVRTTEKALYSPTTATVNPRDVCVALKEELQAAGIQFYFAEGFQRKNKKNLLETTTARRVEYGQFINCAGLYADFIAKQYGCSTSYTILPFKGIYLKYTRNDHPLRVNVYPVPDLKTPFLSVHYTITADNHLKIGPTAIPAFWRENYHGWTRFRLGEFLKISSKEAELFYKNSFGFRDLAFEEMKKYSRSYYVKLAQKMIYNIDPTGFSEWSKPGIRAQLLNLKTNELVQDFVVEKNDESTHVLNAISPAFTSSFPFADWIYDEHLKSKFGSDVPAVP